MIQCVPEWWNTWKAFPALTNFSKRPGILARILAGWFACQIHVRLVEMESVLCCMESVLCCVDLDLGI